MTLAKHGAKEWTYTELWWRITKLRNPIYGNWGEIDGL